jgi:hypothetical protein
MTLKREVVISYASGFMLALVDLSVIGRINGWFGALTTFVSLPFILLAWVTTEFVTGDQLFANGLDGQRPQTLDLLFNGFFVLFFTAVIGSILLPIIVLVFRRK